MPRLKKTHSSILEKATLRASKMQSIDSQLDFGRGLNLTTLNQRIQTLQTKLNDYRTAIETADQVKSEISLLENELGDLCDRMLTGVATQFGKNSSEYVMAGGVRKTDRRRKAAADKD
jgi:uncharacterized coiled-coil DUF342 family protein